MSPITKLEPVDPQELPAPEGELFRRRTHLTALLASGVNPDRERRAELLREARVAGVGALPELRACLASPDPATATLARDLVYELVPDEVGIVLQAGLSVPAMELTPEMGAALLARLERPELEVQTVTAQLDRLAAQAARQTSEALGENYDEKLVQTRGLEVLIQLGEFWRRSGFHGNLQDYHDPRNSWLPDVLATKTGLPLTLSIVFLALCRRLGLDGEGVGLPAHFVVRVEVHTKEAEGFVFLDPFSGAKPLDLDDCRKLVEAAGETFEPEQHLRALPTGDMLSRMCNNLVVAFDAKKQHLQAERIITVMIYLHPQEAVPRLLRAERRLRRGAHRLAREDLVAVLAMENEGPVTQAAARLLAQIQYEHPF